MPTVILIPDQYEIVATKTSSGHNLTLKQSYDLHSTERYDWNVKIMEDRNSAKKMEISNTQSSHRNMRFEFCAMYSPLGDLTFLGSMILSLATLG